MLEHIRDAHYEIRLFLDIWIFFSKKVAYHKGEINEIEFYPENNMGTLSMFVLYSLISFVCSLIVFASASTFVGVNAFLYILPMYTWTNTIGLRIYFIQVVKMLFTVVVVFKICMSPKLLLDFWQSMTEIFSKVNLSRNTLEVIRNALLLLTYMNNSVNAFIYYWTSE